MNNRPKETADAQREKENEAEQPGEAELHRGDNSSDKAEHQPENAANAANDRESAKSAGLEIFAFGRGHDV
jgi:hypothetical protein